MAKVSAYADDLTLFLASRGSFEAVAEALGSFGRAAETRVNFGKSTAMGFGQWAGKQGVPGAFRVERDRLWIWAVVFLPREVLSAYMSPSRRGLWPRTSPTKPRSW